MTWLARSALRVPSLRAVMRRLRERYPDRSQRLVLVWDNWPVHHHPAVVAEAEQQGITLLWLPTYAPWLNPIEKLWRWLKQTLVYHLRQAARWSAHKQEVAAFRDQYAQGGPEVLRYVGWDPTVPPPRRACRMNYAIQLLRTITAVALIAAVTEH